MEILAAVVGSVAGKFAEYTFEPIQRQFGYVISYKSNVQSLSEEVKKLDDQISGVQQLVDAGRRNLRDPMPAVQTWLTEAHQTSEEIGQFLSTEAERVGDGRCLNGWCPDLKSRYSLSRKAKKKTPTVVQLIQSGNFRADQIAGPALPSRLVPTLTMTTRAFQDFESRVSIMGKVIEALKDDTVGMIRICGLGGVGKTTMMNKIVNEVKKDKLFDEVAVAIVSQTPDVKKIQDAIADQLDLKLDRQSEEGRAGQLHARIVKIKKFLLVLDDVWDELQFEKIGLPLGLGYKILITSRSKDVFLTRGGIIKDPINFVVPTLTVEEAWSLFKESAGNCCENLDILPVAKQVLNECGGLPIAIVTVGNTLRGAGSNEHEWSDALRELKRGRHGDKAHSCIKWSYDYLKCKEHQRFFLLCCLFPEDADIPIETLLRYGMGLGLLTNDNYSFQEARNRVRTLVNKLSRLFLLLESKKPEHVKMHDVVRDVGISLASEDKENGLMNTCKYFKKSDEVLSEKHAKLKLLWLFEVKKTIPLDFFEEMKKLNVLSLSKKVHYDYGTRPKLPALQFHSLENIQTLCIEYYSLENVDLSEIGTLGSLEILSFYGSHGVLLPPKLGLLTKLRLLDCRCKRSHWRDTALKVSYGVLSGLKQLEELYLGKMDWQEEEKGKEVANASVAELKGLCNLTTLIITLPKAHLINPKDLHFEKLARFQINMGCEDYQYMKLDVNLPLRNRFAISLQVEERIDQHMGGLINTLLMKTIEILQVDDVNSNSDAEDNNLFDLLQMSLKKGFSGPSPSFSHLRSLQVSRCHSLKYVLPLNVARSLLQLESLEVSFCNKVEEVFYLESISSSSNSEGEGAARGTNTVKLPQLTNLKLCQLPKLTALCKSTVAFELPQLTNLELTFLPNLKSLFTATEIVGTGVGEGECEESSGCSFTLLPTDLTTQLQKLQTLRVVMCPKIEVLFELEKVNDVENATNTILPCLEELCLDYLPKLKKVWKNGAQACQGFQNLKILEVRNCESMEHIVGKGEEEEDKMGAMAQIAYVLFPQLVELHLKKLRNLAGFFNGKEYTLHWMSMKELILDDCPNMKTFSSVSMIDHRGIMSHDHLFNEDVSLVKLDSLEIKKMDCEIIWHCKTQVAVENMIVSDCRKLKNVLASSSDGIKMAKYLEVSKCDSLEDVFRFDCDQGIDASVLKSNGLIGLRLYDLQKLTRICNVGIGPHDHPNHAIIEAALTKGLTALCLHKCPSLQRVFSLSNTTRSFPFPKLKSLHIQNCSMMEEIFANEFDCDCECGTEAALNSSGFEIFKLSLIHACPSNLCLFSSTRKMSYIPIAKEKINDEATTSAAPTEPVMTVLFPELKHLMLGNNANLKWIDAYNAIEFSLEEISISGCPKLEPSSYGSLLNSSKLQSADIVFENQKINVSKMLMLIDGMDTLILEWKTSQPRCFPVIRTLELQNLINFPAATWLHVLQSLPKLETLDISSCGSAEVIFGFEQGLNVKQLLQLKKLKVTSLQKLTCIWMKGIPGLIQRFQNLRELHVGQCHSLMNLLTPSMAKHLVKLTTLTVEDCGMVKVIVSVEEICVTNGNVIKGIGLQEDEGEKISNDKIELFPHLSNLTLKNLPNLTSFCTIQGYTFNWPLLSKVVVRGCPGLEAFTETPMLKEVETDSEKYPLMKHRDATIQLNSKDKDSGADIGEAECYKLKYIDGCDATEFSLEKKTINGCPKLGPSYYIPLLHSPKLLKADITFESQKVRVSPILYFHGLFMSIDGMENLMDMFVLDGKSTPPEYFSQISSLELQNLINFPAAAAWLHVLQSLPKLEKLDISSCGSAEVIFGFEQGLNVKQLPQLKKLKVTSLQKLTCIWMNGIPGLIQRFQNLRELHVGQCHSLRNLLTPSMAKHLVNLTTLMVENCSMVKEIVSVEEICVTKGKEIEEIGVQEDEGEKISNETIQLFPQLSNLTLKNLPNLTSLCSNQGYALNCLLMTKVVVSGCPRLEESTLAVSKTPMLKEHRDATIQLISKEKDARIDIGEAECYKQDARTDLTKQLKNLHLRHVNTGTALTIHLKHLLLDNCSNLQRVFSLSTTARSVLLPQLNELDIRNCSMMEEIFAKEEIYDEATPSASAMINISRILFPKLTYLKLENNANLKWIFKGIEAYDATEFSLFGIIINGCPKFGPSHYIPLLNSPILRKADIVFESQKVSVSTSPMRFPQNFMSIDGMESLMDMLILDEKSTPGYFSQIHSFELRNLLNFPAAAAWMHLIQSLPKLEKLSILSCGSVEVIFVFEQGLNVMQLPPLTELRVTNLEKLTCIWMKGIPEILIQRFENLRELYVGQCHNLKNLLTHSIAKHLLNLKRLTVENCSMVKEIVSVEEKCVTKGKMIKEIGVQEDEGEVIGTKTIKFPRVKHLTFRNLPNLTSFCATPGYTSDWPSLKKVVVTGCPRLETFTLVVPSTPMLKNVETQSKKYPLIEDLNATINQILKEKGSEVGVEGTVTQEHKDVEEEDESLSESFDESTCTEEESDEEWNIDVWPGAMMLDKTTNMKGSSIRWHHN